MKTYFWLFFYSLFIGAGPLAAGDVPTVRLVVVPLGEQTIKQCESSTVKYLGPPEKVKTTAAQWF